MSVQRIQDGLANCCQGLKDVVVSTATWGAKTCQSGFQYISTGAAKVAAWAQPHFETARTFVKENPRQIAAAVGFTALGAILSSLFSRCNSSDPAPARAPRAG